MKRIIKLKHWQVFSILTLFYILIFAFQQTEISIGTLTSLELAIASTIILLILFFLWFMSIGLFLNQNLSAFNHPGGMHPKAQIDFVKHQIKGIHEGIFCNSKCFTPCFHYSILNFNENFTNKLYIYVYT